MGDPAGSHVISPTQFGADPTGQQDASPAMAAAVAHLLTLGGNRTTASGLIDLGGAVLDLEGGVFLISSPVMIKSGYGNYRVQRGTLVAAPSFDNSVGEGYLLQLGDARNCNKTSGGSSNKDCTTEIGAQQLTLDGSAVAFGGLLVQNAMDVNLGPALMVGCPSPLP